MNRLATLPQVGIEANGRPLPQSDLMSLGTVRVQQRLSLPTLCELAFYGPAASLAGTLQPGSELKLTVAGRSLFSGQVTALEYLYDPSRGAELRVRGYDLLHRLRKRQTARAHVQVTVRDLAQELVADLGIPVEAAEPGPLWQRLYQHRQSDLELLAEAADRCGLYFGLEEDVLHLFSLAGRGDSQPLTLGESLLEARLEVNSDPATRSVTALGWDPLRVETHTGRINSTRAGRQVTAEAPPEEVGVTGQWSLLDEGIAAGDHAEALAQAELDRAIAREVTFWGVAEGDTSLLPGRPVELAGIADAFAGRYILTEVTHLIEEGLGYVCELATIPPPARKRPQAAVTTLGIVSQVSDPDNLGRVRVSLPTYGDVESEWMGVLTAGAGKDKGVIALPDVGDKVLVLLAHEDPGQGIVLGGLYGMQEPPDSGVTGGSVRRYTIQTPGKQRIQFDDSGNLLRLENSEGSYIELAPGKLHLHATTDLEIEAPGRSIIIRGQAIDFQRG